MIQIDLGCILRYFPFGPVAHFREAISQTVGSQATHPNLHKVVSLICTPATTYSFIISKLQARPSARLLMKGLIEMNDLNLIF